MRITLSETATALALTALLLGGAVTAGAKETSYRFAGTVVNVNAPAKKLSVKANEQQAGQAREMTFEIDPKATIKMGKKAEPLQNLKTGDAVTITYVERDGQATAEHIQVARARTRPPMPHGRPTD